LGGLLKREGEDQSGSGKKTEKECSEPEKKG